MRFCALRVPHALPIYGETLDGPSYLPVEPAVIIRLAFGSGGVEGTGEHGEGPASCAAGLERGVTNEKGKGLINHVLLSDVARSSFSRVLRGLGGAFNITERR